MLTRRGGFPCHNPDVTAAPVDNRGARAKLSSTTVDGHTRAIMKLKLIAVTGIGLLAGACSQRPLGLPAVYSSLPPANAVARETVLAPAGHRQAVEASAAFAPTTPAPAMPGDWIGAPPEQRGGRVDPVAALNASAQARNRWAALRPGELTRPPLLESRLIQALAGIGRNDLETGSVPGATPSKAEKPARAARAEAKADLYDRDAAMQRLINNGSAAAKNICDGC
jgi:hypothetical protein